jgi:menaquinone-dependent protoporphyrinogen oxidase
MGTDTAAATRILVAFHSAEGQTAKVAHRVATVLRDAGATVEVADVADAPDPAGFAAVVVGDSIHAGRHSRALTRWLVRHAEDLSGRKLALFQVSLASATHDDAHWTEAHRYLQSLVDVAGVHPDAVGLFAGSLAYTRYGWFKKRLMRGIAERTGEPTDTSRDHEFTDWDEVEHFARDVFALVTTGAVPAPIG